MSLLYIELPGSIRILNELFAVAHFLVQKASARYLNLAGQMRLRISSNIFTVFARLVQRRPANGTLHDPARIRWQSLETIDSDEPHAFAASHPA